jgi:CAAX prenyl protease-like protein
MNIAVALAVAVSGLCALWMIQSVVLWFAGEPLTWPFRFSRERPLMRWTGRVMVHSEWIIILVGTPLALGIHPLDALREAFPTPVPWRDIGVAFVITAFPACLVYAVYLAVGWVRFEPQRDQKTRRAKLFRRFFPGPLPLVIFEEGVFRGIILEQLLRSLPASRFWAALALVLSGAAFAAVHFIKPAGDKPIRQYAYGYFLVSCLFGAAYLLGGRSLWLPVVVHATVVFVIEVMRLYVVFQAPPWLVGYPDSPQSGLVGTVVVIGMGIALVLMI